MKASSSFKILGFKKGSEGRGVRNIINMYLATNLTSVTRETPGFTESIQSVDKDHKYLWNYEVVSYTDGESAPTDPIIIAMFSKDGANGQEGVGISTIEEWYSLSRKDSAPETAFTKEIQKMTPEMKYLWNYEVVVYTSGKRIPTTAKIIGVYGEKGEKGDKGDAGTSVRINGSIDKKEDLATKDKVEGVGYLLDGDLWVYNGNTRNDEKHYEGFENVGKIQGPSGQNGQNGQNGEDGRTYYIHFAYANIETGADGVNRYVDFDKIDSTGRSHLGICVNEIEKPDPDMENSVTGAPYNWSLIKGEDGISFEKVVNKYKAVKSGVTPSNTESGWNESFSAEYEKINDSIPYLWNYEELIYSDRSKNQKTTPSIIYQHTKDGLDGTSVVGINEEYRLTDRNGIVIEDWSPRNKVIAPDAPLLWNRECVTLRFADGHIENTPWTPDENGALIGVYGERGDDGTSVKIKPTEEECTEIGDAYINKKNGHLMILVSLAPRSFEDAGKIQGPSGENAWVHIIYAKRNEEGFYDYSKSDTTDRYWMGILSNNIKEDILPEPNDKTGGDYKWSYTRGEKGIDGINGAAGAAGRDGDSLRYIGEYTSHPNGAKNANWYYNSKDKKSYVYQDGSWYTMTVDGKQGPVGPSGSGIEWMGELKDAPKPAKVNWVYKDSDNGKVYICTSVNSLGEGTWALMTSDGNDGPAGAAGSDGNSVFVTYNSQKERPTTEPRPDGTGNGWHTESTSSDYWMKQKVGKSYEDSAWGEAIKIKGEDGKDGISIRVTPTNIVFKKSNTLQQQEVLVEVIDGGVKATYGHSGDGNGYECSTLSDMEANGVKWKPTFPTKDSFKYVLFLLPNRETDIEIPFFVTYKSIQYSQKLHLSVIANGEDGIDGAVVGANLLNGTDLKNNLDSWSTIITESVPQQYDANKIKNGGINGTDALYCKNIHSSDYYDILKQGLNGYGDDKLLPSQWYTLSFWAKGTKIATYLYDNVVDMNEKRYADGVETQSDGSFTWTLTWDNGGGQEWTRHTFTFKTKSSFSPVTNNLFFRIWAGDEVYLSAIKLESGKTATTWCRSETDKNGVEIGINLLEGTNLIRGNRAWTTFSGDVILNGGMFGTNSIKKVFNGPLNYDDMLVQKVSSDVSKDSKLLPSTWYTLSFWARGSRISTYITGKSPIVDQNVKSIADGIEITTNRTAIYTWELDNEWRIHRFTFKTAKTLSDGNCIFRVFKSNNAEVSAIKLEEGVTSTRWCLNEKDKVGAKLRMTEWQEGRRYLSGAAGEDFYDVVLFKYDANDKGTLYLCTKSIDEDSQMDENDPSTSEQYELGIWEVAQNWKFVATDLLLSRRIAAKDIVTEDIIVRKLATENPNGGATVRIENGTIQVFGANKDHPSIEFGVDDNGNAVLRYFDQKGKFLYDLGPNKINEITSAVFIPKQMSYLCEPVTTPTATMLEFVIKAPRANQYYEYQKGSIAQNELDKSIWNNRKMSGQLPDPMNNSRIKDGWYTSDFGSAQQVMLTEMPSAPDILIGFWVSGMHYKRSIFKVVNGFIQPSTKRYVYW